MTHTTQYLGWGGKYEHVEAEIELGFGSLRGLPQHGIRRALWDAACGYVNGFKLSAIIYFVLTRSLNHRVMVWAMTREGFEFRDGIPIAKRT
jgi:hypothetical protein